MKPSHQNLLRSESGQVLPLAAISMLVMAIMVFLSLNISYTVRNRIRLQNYADAKAYSNAVAEARSLNYFAYSNRAIANAYVAMCTLHAYMSMAAMLSEAETAMAEAMGVIAVEELAMAAASAAEWDFADAAEHAVHAFLAGLDAAAYAIAYLDDTMGGRIKKLDKPNDSAFSAFKTQVDKTFKLEQALALAVGTVLLTDQAITEVRNNNMKDPNAGAGVPVNENAIGLGAVNVRNYKNALNDKTGDSKKGIEMTNVVNATRPPFTWDRNSEIGSLATAEEVLFPILNKLKDDAEVDSPNLVLATGQSPNLLVEAGGRSALTDGRFPGIGAFGTDAKSSAQGKSVNSMDWLIGLYVQFEDSPGTIAGPLPLILPAPFAVGELISGDSNSHAGASLAGANIDIFNSVCDGVDHSKVEDTSSFMDYNISTKSADDEPTSSAYNQPVVYSYVSASLRISDRNTTGGPWEINPKGVKIDVGGGVPGKGTVTLGDNGGTRSDRGRAVAKAQVYYHRFGDWKEEPNLFNPYWRAKMESFDSIAELTTVVATGEATDSLDVEQSLGMGALYGLGSGALNIKP